MQFSMTNVDGAFVIELDLLQDHRGFLAREFCESELAEQGLHRRFPQCNISHSTRRGTLRGMHLEASPSEESKIVRCTFGAIYDVLVDLRPESPTYLRWNSIELTRDNRRAIYVPSGCAHGFLTLTDDVDVFHHMGSVYRPDDSRGVRWDDATFGIEWPFDPIVISDRDATHADYRPSVGLD